MVVCPNRYSVVSLSLALGLKKVFESVQVFGIKECRNIGILEYWNVGAMECKATYRSFGIVIHYEYISVGLRPPGFLISREELPSSTQTIHHSNIHNIKYQPPNIQREKILYRALNFPIFIFISVWLSLCNTFDAARGQTFNFVQKVNPFPVQDENGIPYPYPFLGGLNAPRPQLVDIDGDGDPDLFIQENVGELIFFENVGSPTSHQFQWVTHHYEDIDIGEWSRFVDMDSDGDFDLLTARPLHLMRYYRNQGSATSPSFFLAVDTLRDINNSPVPAEVGSIPLLGDIDGDNDPDLFIGRQTGRVTFYRHQGMNANDLPRFEFVTDTFQGIEIIGGGLREIPPNRLHGANSLEWVDIDDDQDLDLFWGDFFSRSLYFLENLGDPQTPDIELVYSEYPPTNPLINGGWNVPRFADIDGDGDFDMFVGEIGGAFLSASSQITNFYFFQNAGSAQNPSFVQQTNQFIRSADVGKASIAALVDIDGDGDPDLFIAGEIDPAKSNNSSLNFFENQGGASTPLFKLTDSDYLNLNLGYSYSPTFVDIDADGDMDLFIGEFFGKVYFLENTGTVFSPDFPDSLIVGNYFNIDVGNNSAPAFVDIDADGDYDLFIGEYGGNINSYENTGSPANPNFVLVTENYLDIDVGENSFPFFADMDGDGDFDLIVGSANNGFLFYRNTGTPQNPDFVNEPGFDVYAPLRSTPILADIDNDSDLDLISGSQGGGLLFYENLDSVTAIDHTHQHNVPTSIRLEQNYPNPFNSITVISWQLSARNNVRLTVYDLLGQKIKTLVNGRRSAGAHRVEWDGKDDLGNDVASGIYIYRIRAGNFVSSRKMLLIR